MHARGTFDDGQSQARARRVAAGGLQSDERTFGEVALLGRNTRTAIGHRKQHAAALLFQSHGDLASAVFDGVIQEVAERAFQQQRPDRKTQTRLQIQRERRCRYRVALCDLVHQSGHIGQHRRFIFIEARVIQKLLYDLIHLPHIGNESLAQGLIGTHLSRQPHPRQGGAQIVRDARQHQRALAFMCSQIGGHLIEGARHDSDLSRGIFRQRLRYRPQAQLLRGMGEPVQRPSHLPGDQIRAQQGQCHHHPTPDQQHLRVAALDALDRHGHPKLLMPDKETDPQRVHPVALYGKARVIAQAGAHFFHHQVQFIRLLRQGLQHIVRLRHAHTQTFRIVQFRQQRAVPLGGGGEYRGACEIHHRDHQLRHLLRARLLLHVVEDRQCRRQGQHDQHHDEQEGASPQGAREFHLAFVPSGTNT